MENRTLARSVALGILAAAIGIGGCGGGSDDKLCDAQVEQDCVCVGGTTGTQVCADDGLAWGGCHCPCVPSCDGIQCGSDGCGGECGLCEDPPDETCADENTRHWFNESGSCKDGACEYTTHAELCQFGCDGGTCLPDPCDILICDAPPGPCHENAGTCVRDPEPHCIYQQFDDGTACNDDLVCNGNETCQAGVCEAGQALNCSGYDDACATGACDEQLGGCAALPQPDGSPCSDGLYCTGEDEVCLAGQCQPGTAVDCSHLDSVCAEGDCSEGLNKCVARALNNGSSCDDGLVCNGTETCVNGICESADPISCPQPANRCWQAACDEAAAGCAQTALADDTPCQDGDECTLADICVSGQCLSGAIAPDGTVCSDGNACTQADACQAGTCTAGEEICSGTVVLLMYMDADNNLDDYLTSDWHEMEAANVEDIPWLRVFVVIDHNGINDAHFYEVLNGTSLELDAPNLGLTVAGAEELNMADGGTVTAFIHDVKAITGDSDYYLMLSDHGDGWRRTAGTGPDGGPIFRGTCTDDHGAPAGDVIYTSELQQAVAGEGLQLISFDACLEGMAEVAYELRNDALVMIGSQELEPGDGWQFTALLSQFGATGAPHPVVYGQIAVDTFIDSYPNDGWNDDITLASYDLTHMDALASAADALANQLRTMEAGAFAATCNAMDWYGCFWGMCEDYTDLTHLTLVAKDNDIRDNDAIYDALLAVLAETVTYERHRQNHPNAHGMNVYFPCAGGVNAEYNANNIQWAADTSWDEMLISR